ncbi:MAG: glycogen/starch synthase, partial [Patescibacteria group bacterium]|nr:glycogen/starch synthase [Patescibacteria group bacterium]
MDNIDDHKRTSLKILFMAAEAAPFVKVGGLGDVAGSLPPALLALSNSNNNRQVEIDIRLVIPFHGDIQHQDYPIHSAAKFSIPYRGEMVSTEVFTMELDGLPIYFISGPLIPPDAPVYSSNSLADGLKYTYFSLAALEMARALKWQPDIIHANDWHSAPSVYKVSLTRTKDDFFADSATLLGVHNLPYLGAGAGPALNAFGLRPALGSSLPWWSQDMPLPLGLLSADHIVAVSPTYAKEILSPEFGVGLDGFLRSRAESISGILNGIDTSKWDPETDDHLEARYSSKNLDLRTQNKLRLQREFDLEEDIQSPLLAMVTRLDYQKGVDLVIEAVRQLLITPGYASKLWQLIILGTGDPTLEEAVGALVENLPSKLRAVIRFDAALSHRIYAGADMLLIPSRYEPCGLTQMIAMRYGCVPIARS